MRRIDTLKNGYKIIQDDKSFCFGIDAVLLASFTRIKNGESVVDLGCGNGIIPLLLHKKSLSLRSSHGIKKCTFTGIEIQQGAVEMAENSVELNGLSDSIKIISGDIKNIKNLLPACETDVVVSNPPYMLSSRAAENATDEKTIARHEVLCSLDNVVKAARYLLKPCGRFYMIHRPYRLQEIFCALEKNHLTPRRMTFVYPSIEKEPEMVMIESRMNYKPDLKVEKPLVMYGAARKYTESFTEYCGL